MYVKENKVQEVNFLASSKLQNYSCTVSDEDVEMNERGKKIVPAGTVYKNEEGKAIGLLFNDVDVTNGPSEAAVMVEGRVWGARLPKTVTDEEKATMTGIKFQEDLGL